MMDSRLVIRVENVVTTSSLEALGVDPNGATCMSNPLWLILLAGFTFFTSRCLIMSILYAYINVENCHTCMTMIYGT